MTTIYVAGSSQEMDRAEAAMDRVRATEGFELAFDWVYNIRKVGASNPEHWTTQQRREQARICLELVNHAGAFWLLLPRVPSVGAWITTGCAWRRGIWIVASGPSTTLFDPLANEHHRTDDSAFQAILGRFGGER